MRQCPRCQAQIPEQARFCTTCGARQPEPPPPRPSQNDDTDVDRPAVASATAILDPMLGRLIGRNYRIEELLGVGGMGKVYRATQLSLDKTVALKLLHPQYTRDDTTVHRFHREARAASSLEHPNIITILDFGQDDDGTLYMAMELLRGRDLHTLLVREGRLDEARACRIVAQVCAALGEAHHKGVIHRDLKLTNIVVEDRPERPDFVKLFDFGIAKVQRPGGHETRILTTSGVVCGTPEYMSPEQIRGHPLDPRTDIYSLGVVLFQLVTTEFPFTADNPIDVAAKHVTTRPPSPRQHRPELSSEMEALILRCLEKKPDKRFASAAELGQTLTRLAQDLDARATAPRAPLPTLAPRLEPFDDALARADTLPDPLEGPRDSTRTESVEIDAAAGTESVTVTVARAADPAAAVALAPQVPAPVTLEPAPPAVPAALSSSAEPVPAAPEVATSLAATAPASASASEGPGDEPASTRLLLPAAPPAPAAASAPEPTGPVELPQPPMRVALLGAVLVAILLTAALAVLSLWRELRGGPAPVARSVDAAPVVGDAGGTLAAVTTGGGDASPAVGLAVRDAARPAAPTDAGLSRRSAVDAARPRAPAARADAALPAPAREPSPRGHDAALAPARRDAATAVASTRPGRLDKRRLFDLLHKGDIRHEAGDYEGALVYYEKALAMNNSEPRVYQKLALAYHNLGRFAESCTALGHFLRLQPHPPGEDYYRALVLRNCQ